MFDPSRPPPDLAEAARVELARSLRHDPAARAHLRRIARAATALSHDLHCCLAELDHPDAPARPPRVAEALIDVELRLVNLCVAIVIAGRAHACPVPDPRKVQQAVTAELARQERRPDPAAGHYQAGFAPGGAA